MLCTSDVNDDELLIPRREFHFLKKKRARAETLAKRAQAKLRLYVTETETASCFRCEHHLHHHYTPKLCNIIDVFCIGECDMYK